MTLQVLLLTEDLTLAKLWLHFQTVTMFLCLTGTHVYHPENVHFLLSIVSEVHLIDLC